MQTDHSAEETPPEAGGPAQAEELGRELGRLRQRGLANVNARRRQADLAVPVLDGLARRHTPDDRLDRVELLRRLLQNGLQAFEEAGFKEDAKFARLLFFGDEHSVTVSREPAGVWLRRARTQSRLGDDQFDERRREVFLALAKFLLRFVTGDESAENGPPAQDRTVSAPTDGSTQPNVVVTPVTTPPGPEETPRGQRWAWRQLLMAAGVIAVFLVLGLLWSRHSKDGDSATKGGASTSAVSGSQSGSPASTGPTTLKFDGLGGGSSIINVYPGVKDVPQDKRPSGTYQSGNTAGAICKLSGRTVTSNTAEGEQPKQSSMWIQIAGSPGLKQYASLTYVDISQSQLQALPDCGSAP